jgi:SAM-dependent methyltransferase
LNDLVSFRREDATKMTIGDDFADRVFCQTVMWTMRDPRAPLKEMIRICKPGGMVGTVEAAVDSINMFYPDDPRLTLLQRAYWKHEAKGFEKLEGLDRNVGYKIPGYLRELGLERVRLDAHARADLDMDVRVPLKDKLEMYRYLLYWAEKDRGLSERERKTLKAGGMKESEMDEFATRYLRFLKKMSKGTEAIGNSSLVNARIYFIATGIKLFKI